MCKIAILEQFALCSSGIRSIIENSGLCAVIWQANAVDKLVASLGSEKPDVVLFDVVHDENSGLKVLRKLNRTFAGVPILLILSKNYSDCFEEYIRLGVKGFVFINSSGEELVTAIKKLKNGEEYFPSRVWDIFRNSIRARKYRKKSEEQLSDREMTVLKLFTNGMSYKEIGDKLNISPRTVETHKRNILSKLKIRSTADMIRYAYRNKILT